MKDTCDLTPEEQARLRKIAEAEDRKRKREQTVYNANRLLPMTRRSVKLNSDFKAEGGVFDDDTSD